MSLSKISVNDKFLEEKAIEELLFDSIEDFFDEPIIKQKKCPRSLML